MFQRLLTLLLALFLISPQPATAFWDDVLFDSPSHAETRAVDAEPPSWVKPVETFLEKAIDWVFELIERPLKAAIQYIADLVARLWSEYVVQEALSPTPPKPEAVILITSNNLKIKDSLVYCHLYQHGASFNRMYRTATNKESIRQSLLSGRYPWRKEESPATTLDAIMQQGGYRTYISPETDGYTPISRFIKEHSGNRLFIYTEVAGESELSELMADLKESGYQAEETLILFTLAGENTPGLKESEIRVSFIACLPGTISPCSADAPLCLVDISRTVATICRLEVPDGALPDSEEHLPDLLWQEEQGRDEIVVQDSGTGHFALICGNYKYIPPTDQGEQLYSLAEDPAEQHNLATPAPNATRKLRQRLQELTDKGETSK